MSYMKNLWAELEQGVDYVICPTCGWVDTMGPLFECPACRTGKEEPEADKPMRDHGKGDAVSGYVPRTEPRYEAICLKCGALWIVKNEHLLSGYVCLFCRTTEKGREADKPMEARGVTMLNGSSVEGMRETIEEMYEESRKKIKGPAFYSKGFVSPLIPQSKPKCEADKPMEARDVDKSLREQQDKLMRGVFT